MIAGAVAMCVSHSVLPSSPLFLDHLISLCQETYDFFTFNFCLYLGLCFFRSKEFAESLENLKEWIYLSPKKACKLISKCGLDYNDGSAGVLYYNIYIFYMIYFLYSFADFIN